MSLFLFFILLRSAHLVFFTVQNYKKFVISSHHSTKNRSSLTVPSIVLAANNLNYIAMMFIRCFCYIFIPLGTVGHLMSIYVFTRPALRINPCSRYFLAATIIGLLNTFYTLPMRMIQSAFVNTDPGAYSDIFCIVVV
jgi:hypothetical protein